MKNKPASKTQNNQDNIGYENTDVRNDQDDKENKRMQPTKVSGSKEPKENENDTEGLRSESGKRSVGKKSGNKERG